MRSIILLSLFLAMSAMAERAGDAPVVFVGDDAVANWSSPLLGGEVWRAHFASGKYKAVNLGVRGDCTDRVLERLRGGLLDKLSPRAVVLMVGANNVSGRSRKDESPLDTALGIREIVRLIQARCPAATVIWHPLLPQGRTKDDPQRVRTDEANRAFGCYVYRMAQGVERPRLLACDFSWRGLTEDGTIDRNVLPDGVQLRKAGYDAWAEAVLPYLDYALDPSAARPKDPPRPAWARDNRKITPQFAQVSKNWLTGGFNAKKRDFVPDERLMEKRRETVDNAGKTYDLVMIGDSITHFFETGRGKDEWGKLCKGRKVLNLGFGGNTVRNALWNVRYGGFLDNIRAKAITLMIGTNNRGDSAEFVAEGIGEVLAAIREKQPQAKVILHPMLPRARPGMEDLRAKNDRTNQMIRKLADGKRVIWVDLNPLYEKADAELLKKLLPDGTHPGAEGYVAWRKALEDVLSSVH